LSIKRNGDCQKNAGARPFTQAQIHGISSWLVWIEFPTTLRPSCLRSRAAQSSGPRRWRPGQVAAGAFRASRGGGVRDRGGGGRDKGGREEGAPRRGTGRLGA